MWLSKLKKIPFYDRTKTHRSRPSERVRHLVLHFKTEFLSVILWMGNGLYTSPPWFLGGSRRNLIGTDNLSGPESDLAKSEFENSNRLPWKSWNADFEAPFDPERLRFCHQTVWIFQWYWHTIFVHFKPVSMGTAKIWFWNAESWKLWCMPWKWTVLP